MKIPQDWTFENDNVAAGFDRHVREQLPWYDLATNSITHIARHYISKQGLVYDIGAATGNIGRALKPVLDDRHAEFFAVEPAYQMNGVYDGPGKLLRSKAEECEYAEFDLAVLFLTLMFIDPCKRLDLMYKLRASCKKGGAIIVFDKVENEGGYISTIMSRLTLAGKKAAGVDSDEIIQKELSLCGVQRPLRIEQLGGNFTEWFRFGEFRGWVLEKPAV